MEISHIWNVIFISAFSQGFFVALILFLQFYFNRHRSQLYLGLFVLNFSLILINNTVYWNQLFSQYPHFLFVTLSLRYLMAPLFLFYIFTFIGKKNDKKQLWHLLPFAIALAVYLPSIFQSGDAKIAMLINPVPEGSAWRVTFGQVAFKLTSIHLILYAIYIFRLLKRHFNPDNKHQDRNKNNQILWLQFLNSLFFLYGLLMLLYFILIGLDVGGIKKDYFISLIMSIAVYGISIVGIFNTDLLSGEKFLTKLGNIKYLKTRLTKSYLVKTMAQLEQIMQTERLFLNSEINLDQVASRMGIPRHHISQALSLEKGKTFNEFINHYRIKHAQLLLDNLSAKDNIKTVMHSSGFNNRVSFNNNFKKMVGMTASDYVKASKN